MELTGTAAQTIATYTPSAAGAFLVGCRLRVTTATTVVTAQVTYTDATGAQTSTWLNAVPKAPGSYDLMPIVISSAAGSAITVSVTAGTANQVYAGAAIWGTASGSAIASYDTTVLTKLSLAPVAYWKLNDPVGSTTAADSSGNGYTLTVNGTVTFGEPSVVPSDSETSAKGDGSTGYLESSGVPSLIPTGAPMTIIACVAQGASAASGSIVGYGTSAMLSLQAGQLQWNLTSSDYARATDAIASSPLLLVARMTAQTAQLNANGSPVTGVALTAAAVGSGPAYIFSWGSGGQYGSQPVGRVAFFAGLLTPKDEELLMQAFTGV